MSNEAASPVSYERANVEHTCEKASTIQTVISTIQDITTTHTHQLALVTITLRFALEGYDEKTPRHRHLVAQSIQYYLDALRRLVRKTDVVYLLDSSFHFLLIGATTDGGNIVKTRLWDALLWCVHNIDEADILRPRIMTIGHAAYAASDGDAYACILAANEPCYSFDTQPELNAIEIPQENDVASANIKTVSREGELTALARQLGVPYLSLLPRKKPEQVQRLVTLKLAHELQCYPLGRERGTLTVALSNPQDSSILARLHKETGLRIFPVLTHPQELQTALSLLV